MITSFDKAIVTLILGGLTAFLAQHHIIINSSLNDALQVILTAVVAAGAVYLTPNKPKF